MVGAQLWGGSKSKYYFCLVFINCRVEVSAINIALPAATIAMVG
jgi:hypothetical protein